MFNISNFDWFGTVVGLRYSGNWRYKSVIGGYVTILTILMTLSIIIYFVFGFITRSTLRMTSDRLKYWDPPMFNLSNDFQMAIMMKYGGQNIFRDDIVSVSFDYIINNNKDKIFSIVSLPLINCTLNRFKEAEYQYNALKLSNALCVDLTNITIQGSSVNDLWSYVRVNFLFCDPSNTVCLNETLAEDYMSRVRPQATLFFLDTTFTISNYPNMVKKFINSVDVNVTYGNSKSTDVYFQNNEIIIQNGYIFSVAPEIISNFMYENYVTKISLRTTYDNNALFMNVLASKNQSNIYLSFLQISELLANIGGILNSIVLMIKLIMHYVNNSIYQIEFIQNLYRVKTKESNEGNKNIKKIFGEIINISQSKSVIKDITTDGITQKNLEYNQINAVKTSKSDNNQLLTKSDLVQNKEFLQEMVYLGKNKIQLNKNDSILQNKNILHFISNDNKLILTDMNNLTQDKVKINLNNKNDVDPIKDMIDFHPTDIFFIMFCCFFRSCSGNVRKKFETNEKIKKYLDTYQDFNNIFKKQIEIDLIK